MGDFAGAVLKYLRRHPVPRLTIAGGIGKLAKLADGHLDLHSARSQVDLEALAALVRDAGGAPELVEGVRGGEHRARRAAAVPGGRAAAGRPGGGRRPRRPRSACCAAPRSAVDVVVIDRAGTVVGRA